MTDIKMGPGTLFFRDENDELLPLGDVTEGAIKKELTECIEYGPLSLSTEGKATLTISLSTEKMERLLQVLLNVTNTVLGILRNQGNNPRVCHLAKYAKKHRTRKKNIRRAYRILEKEG